MHFNPSRSDAKYLSYWRFIESAIVWSCFSRVAMSCIKCNDHHYKISNKTWRWKNSDVFIICFKKIFYLTCASNKWTNQINIYCIKHTFKNPHNHDLFIRELNWKWSYQYHTFKHSKTGTKNKHMTQKVGSGILLIIKIQSFINNTSIVLVFDISKFIMKCFFEQYMDSICSQNRSIWVDQNWHWGQSNLTFMISSAT